MGKSIVVTEQSGAKTIITLTTDHIDASNVAEFRAQSAPLIQQQSKVILDLTGVNFIDSAGLGSILSLMRGIGERGGDFRVCCVSKPIQVLFELVRLQKILDIHETRQQALAAGS